MPKLTPKEVQKQLQSQKFWPVYWLHGTETMKSRELLKRIRNHLFGNDSTDLSEEHFDGGEASPESVLDAAQSLSLLGGTRLIVVKNAHQLKKTEVLEPLLGEPTSKNTLSSVCVFLSKDLDRRKKFSKKLMEKAAVVPCEAVPDAEKGAWVEYLAKQRKLDLDSETKLTLSSLDPWSLDLVDQELEKFSLASDPEAPLSDPKAVLFGQTAGAGAQAFVDRFFGRDLKLCLDQVESFSHRPDESIPLLGLLAWNTRQLAIALKDPRSRQLSPFMERKLNRWTKLWSINEVLRLQEALSELDFNMKQTPKSPLGNWADFVMKFSLI